MRNQYTPTRGILAYDAVSGRILHAHFTESTRPQHERDPAEAQLHHLIGSQASEVRFLAVEPGELERGIRYRVDTVTGKLVPAADGEPGFAASAGSMRGSRA